MSSSNSSSARQGNSGSDQYYDNTYTYMHGVPNYGVTSYAPYSSYTTLSYGAGSAWGGGYGGFSPYSYGVYDPFYSSFYNTKILNKIFHKFWKKRNNWALR